MALRVGILPHGDLPHIVPCFRMGRELLKWGHGVSVFASEVETFHRIQSGAWREQLAAFGLTAHEVLHRGQDAVFHDWLLQQLREQKLDVMVLDAVWQGLAFACHNSGSVKNVVIHHAGLPDFRSGDMPTWGFVHPGHSRDRWAQVRASLEQFAKSGHGNRRVFSAMRAQTSGGAATPEDYELGCTEFATLPATRAMSLCPAVEFPAERGRIDYFGTLLPKPGDPDWRPPLPALVESAQTLIACIFGTTALQTKEEYQWLAHLSGTLARFLPDCQILSAIPEWAGPPEQGHGRPSNLAIYPWIPLWEMLSTRKGLKIMVAPPGVGAFREAMASGTPIVAVPRRLDQFGAAARVEYFKVGCAVVSQPLPEPGLVLKNVVRTLEDYDVHGRAQRMSQVFAAFDATLPLKRFMENAERRGEK